MAENNKTGALDGCPLFQPEPSIQKNAHVQSLEQYQAMYKESLQDPVSFWGRLAKEFFHWKSYPTTDKFLSYNFDPVKGPISIKWMEGGITNICYSVLDRHVENGLADKVAFYW